MESQIDEAIDWIEEGRWLSAPTESDWSNVFTKIKAHLIQNPLDANAHYVLGYAYFSKGDNKNYPEIESHLLRSLELEPQKSFPLFFLGMYYFNCGLYAKSLAALSEVDFSFFTSIKQHYRIAEVIEVIACDRLYLDPSSVEVSDLIDLAKELIRLAKIEAKEMDFDDISLCAVTPYALTRCVDSLFQRDGLHEKAAAMFDVVFDLLVKLGRVKYVAKAVDRVRIRLSSERATDGDTQR